MENQDKTNAQNALQILAQAADAYVKSLDSLGQNFVGPQVNAALQIFAGLVNEKFPGGTAVPAVASEAAAEQEA